MAEPAASPRGIGLRGRIALAIAAIVTLALAATFALVYRQTGAALRAQIEHRLEREAGDLSERLARVPSGRPAAVAAAARSYVRAQPLGPSVRVYLVTVPGAGAVSNEPELAGRGSSAEPESAAERRREASEGRALRTAPDGFSTVALSDAGELRVLTRHVTRDGRRLATVRVGEPLEPVEDAREEVARAFALAGGAALLAALAAGLAVAARMAAPLRRMARTAREVDAGELSHRIGARGPRDELRLLADSFDHMLDRLEDAFERQRAFAADASHELRTPLTAVRGQIEVLDRSPEVTREDVTRVAAVAEREIGRMQRLIDDLLLLARGDDGRRPEPEPVDVPAFLASVVEEAEERSPLEVRLESAPAGSLYADPDQLRRIMRNLLANAERHARSGVRVSALADGGRLTVRVDDDGAGIPAADRERVFDRFHRLDDSRSREAGGSGLGLAIARSLVEAHGGRIRAEAAPGGGARLAFELPGFRAREAALG
jgi:signal transduction histidine kinase